MQHHRVEREQRAEADDAAVGVGVAVGDPALAVAADAGELVVLAAAPDRVGGAQPERRRPGAGRQVDEQVGPDGAQVADQGDGRGEVAVERAARRDLVGRAAEGGPA